MSGSFGTNLTGFTTSINTASPNNTVNIAQLLANVVSTNGDIVLSPKGTGAILAQVPDGTATGGDKRGTNAVDLQTLRTANTQVASGPYSALIAGSNNTASGNRSTVLSGFTNTASGSYATILGGATNTASAIYSTVICGLENTVSGDYSAVISGSNNTVSGFYSAVIAGINNTASGNYSAVLTAFSSTASGIYALVLGGSNNTASGDYSVAFGRSATTNSYGKIAFSSGAFTTVGDCQIGTQVLRRLATNTTPVVLTADNSAPSTTNQIQLQNNQTIKVRCDILARSSTGLTKNIVAEAVLKRGASASTTTISTPIYTTIYQDSGTANWTMVLSADTTNGCGAITFTIDSVLNVRCMAKVETVELIY